MATKKKKKGSARKRRKLKIIVFVIEILILLLVLAALYVSIKMSKMNTGVDIWDKDGDRQVNELTEKTKEHLEKYTTIALFGLDNRSKGQLSRGNSDVIILASINEDTKEVKMVSVYRDTYLDITDGRGFNKANAAYAYGGPKQAINMLNTNLDLDIKDYVTVDFNAVAETIDLLGGVEVEITKAEAHYMEGYIEEVARISGKKANYLPGAGTYLLDGVQATAYARVRQTTGWDYKRTERQRLIIEKMVEKALHSDLATINSIIDEVFPDIETSLSQTDILMLAKDAFSYSLGENKGFPFEKQGTNIGKYDCVVPLDLESNVAELHEFLYENQDYEVSSRVKEISEQIVQKSGLSAADAQPE